VAAHASFFADANGLHESFAAMARFVAARFAGDATVIGYELFNEPITTDDLAVACSTRVARAIRQVDAPPRITCDGKEVRALSVDAPNGLYTVACGGRGAHTLTFE
jgi:hypothetical protein